MKKVFIAAGCPFATVTRYRCIHLQEQFASLGIESVIREWSEELPSGWLDEALSADLIVLQRVPINNSVRHLIASARQSGKQIAFDTDDLIFEPQLTAWHRGVANLSADEQVLYQDGVQRYLATLEASDFVITASPLLAELAQRRGKSAFVHRNAIGNEMQQLGEQLFAAREKRDSSQRVVIGYGSGTPTHDVDFEQAALALVDIMTRYSQVELWLAGPLQLPPMLDVFQKRIRRFPLTDWNGWFALASQFDINLAPLEQGNIFCRAKSEIKFVEAALLGVPTVASSIDPFEYAIRHGENGFLAGNVVEWIDALEKLVTQPALRQKVALAARNTAEEQYSLSARANQLARLLQERKNISASIAHSSGSTALSAQPEDEQFVPLVVNWIVSEPFQGSGGHLGIFRMVKHLVDFGHECHIYVLPLHVMYDYSAQQLRDYADRYFLQTGATFHRWNGFVGEADATVATYWRTVAELQKLPNPGQSYYLVQDFEPYFYAVGTEYLLCENTYRAGVHCLTLGPWLEKLLRERYQSQADHFDFAIDPEIYTPSSNPRQPWQRVLFYARPSTPRRGYELGIAALQIVKARKPDVEIVLFGADTLDPIPFQYTSMGIRSPHELASLYSSSDVGLVLSLTNPSFVPFEMMACGCAVVDIRSERLEGLLEHGVNALLAEPTPSALADAVLSLLENQVLRQKIINHGLQRVNELSWRNSARQIEDVLLRHASAISNRTVTRRLQNNDASAMLWQIQQLLGNLEKQNALTDQLYGTLTRVLVEKAELSQQLQKCQTHKQNGERGAAIGVRKLVQPIQQKVQEKTPLWSLNGNRMTKLFLSAEPHLQRFRSERSHLAGIELLFAKIQGSDKCVIRCTLIDESSPDYPVTIRLIPIAEVQPNQPYAVNFEPITQSYEHTYILALSVEGDAEVAIWYHVANATPGSSLWHGKRQFPGQLSFQPRHQVYGQITSGKAEGAGKEMPVKLIPIEKANEALRLLQKTGETVRTKGVFGLLREIENYIQWQKMQR